MPQGMKKSLKAPSQLWPKRGDGAARRAVGPGVALGAKTATERTLPLPVPASSTLCEPLWLYEARQWDISGGSEKEEWGARNKPRENFRGHTPPNAVGAGARASKSILHSSAHSEYLGGNEIPVWFLSCLFSSFLGGFWSAGQLPLTGDQKLEGGLRREHSPQGSHFLESMTAV